MKGEFYKMDFRAWNVGTVDLTLEQEAAYLRLCHAMYDVGGPVPNSTRMLMGLFRCGNVKALALLAGLIKAGKIAVTSDDRLINHRVTEELASREKVSAARRISGERGGSAPRVTAECYPSDPRVTPECLPSDSRVAPSKPLKNNASNEAFASALRSRGEEKREEKKDNPQDPSGSSAPKGAKRPERGSFLDRDWKPSEADWSFARSELGDDLSVAREREKFRNYWFSKSGADGRKRDWPATWRNWIMRAAENGKRSSDLFPGSSTNGRSARPVQSVAAAAVARHANREGLGSRGWPDDPRPGDPGYRRSGGDDPEIADAEWSSASRHRAAH